MKLTFSKGFAAAALCAGVALAGCSSSASEPPSPLATASAAPSASPTATVEGLIVPASPEPAEAGVVDVKVHPGEAFFVIAPPPDVITSKGLTRTVAMHEAQPAGVVSEWVVDDQERTIELAKAAAQRDPDNVVGVLWFAEKPGHAKFDVQWADEDGTVDPQWSRSYVVTVTK